jgi:hypothetical protein
MVGENCDGLAYVSVLKHIAEVEVFHTWASRCFYVEFVCLICVIFSRGMGTPIFTVVGYTVTPCSEWRNYGNVGKKL